MNAIELNILQNRLEAYLAAQPFSENSHVTSFQPIGGQWNTHLYAFTLEHNDPGDASTQRLILKTFPNTPDGIDHALKERHALYNLRVARYPVPSVVAVEIDPYHLDVPFLIREDLTGSEIYYALENADERERRGIIAQFAGLLADLHGREPQLLVKQLPKTSPAAMVNREIHTLRSLAEKRGLTNLDPVINWLHEQRGSVSSEAPVITNRDFTLWNVMQNEQGRMSIPNWRWQIGDSRFDVAWTLLDLERTGGIEGLRDEVLAEYERVTGKPVSELAFFEVAAATRWLLDVLYEARQGYFKLDNESVKAAFVEQIAQASAQIAHRAGITLPAPEALLNA